jgi:hypothetical protein
MENIKKQIANEGRKSPPRLLLPLHYNKGKKAEMGKNNKNQNFFLRRKLSVISS